jgi:undecaprenyl-diphosphatase
VGIVELEAALARWLNAAVCGSALARKSTAFASERLAPVEVLLMLALAASGKRASAARMLVAVATVYVACEALGALWPRQRPFSRDSAITVLVPHDAERSFPSRHVASGLAMAAIGGRAHRRLGGGMTTVAWALGVSRVAAGLHYPSDVLGGALLGLVIGYALRA